MDLKTDGLLDNIFSLSGMYSVKWLKSFLRSSLYLFYRMTFILWFSSYLHICDKYTLTSFSALKLTIDPLQLFLVVPDVPCGACPLNHKCKTFMLMNFIFALNKSMFHDRSTMHTRI